MALGWRKEYIRYKEYFLNVLIIYKQKEDLRMFLEILLSLVTVSFFGAFALRPTLVTITALLTEIDSKEEIVTKLDTKIPATASPETFVRQFEGLAAKNGINLLGVSLGQVTLLGEVKKVPPEEGVTPLPEDALGISFSVSLSGNYSELLGFLADLEKLRRPLAIDTTGMTTTETEEGKTLVILVSGRAPYIGK